MIHGWSIIIPILQWSIHNPYTYHYTNKFWHGTEGWQDVSCLHRTAADTSGKSEWWEHQPWLSKASSSAVSSTCGQLWPPAILPKQFLQLGPLGSSSPKAPLHRPLLCSRGLQMVSVLSTPQQWQWSFATRMVSLSIERPIFIFIQS